LPIICSICESVIREDLPSYILKQGAKSKPICKACLKELPKAHAFVKAHNENIGGMKSESIGIKGRKH
jgi:hypothetical protein